MKKLAIVLALLVSLTALARAADTTDLEKRLKSSDPDVRRAAAKALGELGPEAKSAVPALIVALKDSDLYVRRFSAQALGEIGPEASAAVKPLTAALKDPRKEVASAAANALGKMGPAAVEPLSALVGDRSRDAAARREAIEALAALGKDAKSAVPALVTALKDRDLRIDAANALGALGPDAKEALKELEAIAASKERDRNFRSAVTAAIRKINK